MTQNRTEAALRRGHGMRSPTLPTPLTPSKEDTAAERWLVRMALDLHDGPLQDLAALGFTLSLLQRRLADLPAPTADVADELAEVQRQLGAVETTLRAVATGGAAIHDGSALIDLVEAEIVVFRTRSSSAVELDVVGDVEPATASQRIAIHRVLREALSNVARHSGATEVLVSLVEADDVIHLRVSDNGRGFDPMAGRIGGDGRARLGLTGMRRRLELLDGTLTIDSRPGGPTAVTAAVKRWRPAVALNGAFPSGERRSRQNGSLKYE